MCHFFLPYICGLWVIGTMFTNNRLKNLSIGDPLALEVCGNGDREGGTFLPYTMGGIWGEFDNFPAYEHLGSAVM